MLMPKRVKRRRVFRGRMKGKALRGNTITYGEYGLVAQEPAWVTSNQIEAASGHAQASAQVQGHQERDGRGRRKR